MHYNYKSDEKILKTLYRRSSYKVVMDIEKLRLFCNTSSPDDGPTLDRKYLGNN